MASPKPNPKIQNRIPIMSSLCPSIPRNDTEERSGSLRLASLPASSADWANALDAHKVNRATAAVRSLPKPRLRNTVFASQVRMRVLPELERFKNDNWFSSCVRTHGKSRALPKGRRGNHGRSSEHASTARLNRSAELGRVGGFMPVRPGLEVQTPRCRPNIKRVFITRVGHEVKQTNTGRRLRF